MCLVVVVFEFVWIFDGYVDVCCLFWCESGKLCVQCVQVELCYFFVECFGQYGDVCWVGGDVCVQFQLCQYLIGEGGVYYEGGVFCGVVEVYQLFFVEDQYVVFVWYLLFVYLWFDFDFFYFCECFEVCDVDFVVEVFDVGDDCEVFECLQVFDCYDVVVFCVCDDDVDFVGYVGQLCYLEVVYGGLQSVDGVDFVYDYVCVLILQCFCCFFVDIVVVVDEGDFVVDEYIGCLVEFVWKGVLDVVFVVEFVFGY